MGMSTHVVGFKPPDEKWKKMKDVWDACCKANVKIPTSVSDFFGGEPPDANGVVVDEKVLQDCGAVREYRGDAEDGFDLFVEHIPKDVKIVRVCNSY